MLALGVENSDTLEEEGPPAEGQSFLIFDEEATMSPIAQHPMPSSLFASA
jgi:hypothetical protein